MNATLKQVLGLWAVLAFACGCASPQPTVEPVFGNIVQREEAPPAVVKKPSAAPKKAASSNPGWTERVLTLEELDRLGSEDPELSPSVGTHLLARLNVIAPYYVADAVREGQPLKVPNDFSAFKHWTPLPRTLHEVASVPKLIVIIKDLPFVGWYQNGRLVGDTYACIGKINSWTKSGVYRVLEKDIDHISRSYTNAYGLPAPMPWALRIYGHVWIHAGDITKGYCSHGCINLPVPIAPKLFEWATVQTPVVIVETMNELKTVLDRNGANCTLYARECSREQRDYD
ncbi:MAG: L,D-transpeptidase [Syntrophobacteraceae bacterium]